VHFCLYYFICTEIDSNNANVSSCGTACPAIISSNAVNGKCTFIACASRQATGSTLPCGAADCFQRLFSFLYVCMCLCLCVCVCVCVCVYVCVC
jgi:hypothetical protein